MKMIDKKNWEFSLLEDGDRLILCVLAGTVALYEIPIVLEPSEAASYRANGVDALTELANKVRYSPSNFENRRIPHPMIDL